MSSYRRNLFNYYDQRVSLQNNRTCGIQLMIVFESFKRFTNSLLLSQLYHSLAAFEIKSIRLITQRETGECKGFAFLEFYSPQQAAAFMDTFGFQIYLYRKLCDTGPQRVLMVTPMLHNLSQNREQLRWTMRRTWIMGQGEGRARRFGRSAAQSSRTGFVTRFVAKIPS